MAFLTLEALPILAITFTRTEPSCFWEVVVLIALALIQSLGFVLH